MTDEKQYKSGYAAIIGKPNVGKSTVLNSLIGEKVAIVSKKPQTTRNNITGILTREDAQVVFIDTPGIHEPWNLLGKNMVRLANESLNGVDLIIFVLDAKSGLRNEDENIFKIIKGENKPVIILINKVDLVDKLKVLPLIDTISKMGTFKEIIPVSAEKGDNMDVLLKKIIENLPYGPKYFPDDQITDKNERFIVAELIREKVLILSHEEIPHSVAVLVEEFKERTKSLIYIRATVFVEKLSQKKIIVGHKGQMLKKIGEKARKDMQAFFNKRIYLDLWVKVYENWRKDAQALRMLEYK